MAASFGPYFMNAATFSETSGLWTTSALTVCAPSGYYSNGVIIRYLDNAGGTSGCCLGPVLDCPQCEPPVFECGTAWDTSGSVKEIYETTVNTGSGTGVFLVGLDPANIPDGVAARFPAGIGGTIYSSGVSQALGFASNNYNGASTNLYDHACIIGNANSITTSWPGTSASGTACDGIIWNCAGSPPPISEPGYQRKQWNDALGDWEDIPGAPLVSVEISNYNVGSAIGSSSDTQMRPLGLNAAGVCTGNDSIAPCNGTTGMFWIPITKTSLFDQQVEVCFTGGPDSNTGYSFAFTCPTMPTQFGISDISAPLLSSPDPLATPSCTNVAYPDVLYQASVWVSGGGGYITYDTNTSNAINSGLAQTVLGQHCFAYQTAMGTGLRINEGGTEYQWFKVNLNTGGGNANRCITIGTNGQSTVWQNFPELQAALIQIDWNGVITRIEPCES